MHGLLISMKSSDDAKYVIAINSMSLYGRTIASTPEVSKLFDSIIDIGTRISSIASASSNDIHEYRDEVLSILDRILELL